MPRLPESFRALLAATAARLGPRSHGLRDRIAKTKPARLVSAVWANLLDEACEIVAPVLKRVSKDERLVAVPRTKGGLDVFLVKGDAVTRLLEPPTEAKSPSPVELRLRPDQMLERSLTLPAASRDFLESIIEHRLERLAPWRRDTILHGFEVGAGDGGMLTVRVLLTSTEIVAGPVEDLRRQGLAPACVGGQADRLSEPLRIAVGRGAAIRRPSWQKPFGRLWLAGTAVLCALAIGMTVSASMAEARRATGEAHLVKARKLIREAADAASPDNVPLLADKRPERATMVLIDTLAAALPDTSYLRELSVTPESVRLVGTSTDAPALIPLIEKAGLHNVRFTGPVQRGDDKRDTFEITADREARKDPQ